MTQLQVDHWKAEEALKEGGRFVKFECVFSFIFVSVTVNSSPYLVRKGESAWKKGLLYSFITFFLGWWSFPFGPINTIKSLIINLSGGEDITAKVSKDNFGIEDVSKKWDCPKCGQLSPNTTYVCIQCGYSLI